VLLIALSFGLLYFVGVRPLAALLDERQTPSTAMTRTLRQATRYETIRPLLAIFSAMIALALLVGLVARTLTLSAFIIGGGIAALLLWLAATSEA
jgi:predicted lysophospholipase L1 biosynthesis ABC-type transport system permease subunit